MAAFTKSDLAAELAARSSMSQRPAAILIDSLFDIIREKADAGNAVAINGFGRFSVKERPARPGRNPRTGEPMEYAASRTLTFKASKTRS